MKLKNFIICFFLILGFTFFTLYPGQVKYDIIIKNGKVFDGSIRPSFRADVAIKNGIIVEVSKSIEGKASRIINAKGLYVMPGFIDMHTHVDRGMYFPENRACLNYLLQGVTTVIVGQCGSSAWPIFEKAEDQMERWSEEGIGPNAALLIGHGTVRQIVMGMEDREPTEEELEKMKLIVKEAMEQGAYGLSTGLIYLPGRYAKTEEIIELAKIVAPYGGIYHSHIRNEREKLLEAINEAIRIGEEANIPVHISHFKVMGKSNWGLIRKACDLIEEARSKGLKVTADQYPYRFSSNNPYRSLIPKEVWLGESEGLTQKDIEEVLDYLRDNQLIELYSKITPYFPLSPRHIQFLNDLPRKRLVSLVARTIFDINHGPENTRERMLFLKRLNDPIEGKKIREEVKKYIEEWVGAENFIIAICVEKKFEGKSLKEIAKILGKSIEDTAIELELMGAKAIPFQMCEEDIEYIMRKDWVATGSDGVAPFYGIGLPHIRSYSTFLHKIKKYGIERKTVSLSHIIRSQTSLPAEIMNWKDRGWIKKGYKADIAVIDLKNIKIKTSVSNPHQYCKGVKYLLVNGVLTIDKDEWTGKLPGEVIRLKKTATD